MQMLALTVSTKISYDKTNVNSCIKYSHQLSRELGKSWYILSADSSLDMYSTYTVHHLSVNVLAVLITPTFLMHRKP